MAGISIFALVRRFGSAWRNDGLFAAISRAGSYVRRRVQGAGITILGGQRPVISRARINICMVSGKPSPGRMPFIFLIARPSTGAGGRLP